MTENKSGRPTHAKDSYKPNVEKSYRPTSGAQNSYKPTTGQGASPPPMPKKK